MKKNKLVKCEENETETSELNSSKPFPDVKRDEWSVEKISAEGANEDSTDILQKMLIGDELNGDTDQQDVVNWTEDAKTPQQNEEIKEKIKTSKEVTQK